MATDDCVKGLIVGGLIGLAVGILYAPKKGKETREEIRKSTEELFEKAKKQYEHSIEKIEKLVKREEEMIADKKERIRKAIKAGVETLKEEQSDTLPQI